MVSGKRTGFEESAKAERLLKGPAYDDCASHGKRPANLPGDWATLRANAARSGSVETPVTAELKPAWETRISGRLTQPVVAGEKVFVALRIRLLMIGMADLMRR